MIMSCLSYVFNKYEEKDLMKLAHVFPCVLVPRMRSDRHLNVTIKRYRKGL